MDTRRSEDIKILSEEVKIIETRMNILDLELKKICVVLEETA